MHGFWLREHDIAGNYVALPVQRHELSESLAGLQAAGFAGVNITLPHKQAAFALAHAADPAALAAGAANLLLFRNRRYAAFNTDVEGLVQSLQSRFPAATGLRRAVVLGAGGAARAAVLACSLLQAEEICVVNRTKSHAESLVRAMSGAVCGRLTTVAWDAWEALAGETRLLINATSAGLDGTSSPEFPLALLPNGAVVCDLVYRPLETPLLAAVKARGLVAVDGLGMLMHQGALAFELLFGIRPTVSAGLRACLEQTLRDEQ
jgi:shikimate dehydrogenase